MHLQNASDTKHIPIHAKPIDIEEDEPYCMLGSETADAEAEDSDCVEIKPPPRADRCRCLSTIPDKLQYLVRRAQTDIVDYTLFTMPFMSPVEVLFLLSDAWEGAQDSERKFKLKNKAVDAYLSRRRSLNVGVRRTLIHAAQIRPF